MRTAPVFVMTDELVVFFFSSRRRHTRFDCDWSSDVCSSDLQDRAVVAGIEQVLGALQQTLTEAAVALRRQLEVAGQQRAQRAFRTARRIYGKIGRASCRERV